jgi:hypothetical protein
MNLERTAKAAAQINVRKMRKNGTFLDGNCLYSKNKADGGMVDMPKAVEQTRDEKGGHRAREKRKSDGRQRFCRITC